MALKEVKPWADEIVARSARRFPSLERAYWELFAERLKTAGHVTAALREAEEKRGAPWVMVGFDANNWLLGETSFEVPNGPEGEYSTLTFEQAKAAAESLGGRLMTWEEAQFASSRPENEEHFPMDEPSAKAWSVDSGGAVSFIYYERFGSAQKSDVVPEEQCGFRFVIELPKPTEAVKRATIKAGENVVREKADAARNYVRANSSSSVVGMEMGGSVAGAVSALERLKVWILRGVGEA